MVLKGCGKERGQIGSENSALQVSGKLRVTYLEVVFESEIRLNQAVLEAFLAHLCGFVMRNFVHHLRWGRRSRGGSHWLPPSHSSRDATAR
jgi:hypothetical protein